MITIIIWQYGEAEATVKKLIEKTPQKLEWWSALSGLYAQRGQHAMAMSSMMLFYHYGQTTDEDVMQLIQYNASQGYPVKAARLLESEFERHGIPHSYQNLNYCSVAGDSHRNGRKAFKFWPKPINFPRQEKALPYWDN